MVVILTLATLFYALSAVVFLYIFYKFLMMPYNLKKMYGFSGPTPLPIFGNLIEYVKKGFHVCDKENQRKYGHIYPVYLGRVPFLVVSDQTVLRQILVKDAKSFIDRLKIRGSSKIMKHSLLQLKGKNWERVRALVSPTFSSGKLKKMSPMIVAGVEYMMERLDTMKELEIDMKEVFGLLTMDIIAKTMFGIEIDKNPSNSFVKFAKQSVNISLRNPLFATITLIPLLAPLIEWLNPNGIISPNSMDFFQKSLAKAISIRTNEKEMRNDFLSLMITAHEELQTNINENENNSQFKIEKGLTEEEIMAQSILFLLAGYETTASALSFCSYYLAMNQSILEEVYQELQNNLANNQSITYDILSKLNLLECCLLETLRICPPAVRIQRVCTNDSILISSTGQSINIKKGMKFIIPIYAIHNDEALWPDAKKFDIHRFDSEEKQKRSQYTFLPFGTGPRVCVGQRFALLEAKLALAYLLKKYKLVPCSRTPEKLTFGISGLTKVLEPVILKLEERQN